MYRLFIRDFNPEYCELKMGYRMRKNVETFNEFENRSKFFEARKIAHKQIIEIAKNSETKLAKDIIKDSRKRIKLIEKQMQIFELQKQAYILCQ